MSAGMEETEETEEQSPLERYRELFYLNNDMAGLTETAEYGSKLITLSTCEYSRTNGRLVVAAKKIVEE